MTWFSQPLADWLMSRLSDSSITSLLPSGADSIYRGTRPQGGSALPRFLAFDQRGSVATVCLPSGKDALQARYGVQVWEASDDSDGLAAIAAAIDAQLAHVRASSGGYQFVSEPLGEINGSTTEGGVQYVTAGGLYEITAEAA